MTTKLSNILIVEDNLSYLGAASRYFSGKNVETQAASDYNEAIAQLRLGGFSGAIIDCFFPSGTGDNRTLGQQAIEKMLADDKRGQRIERYERYLSESLDYKDPEVKRIARYIGSIADKDDPEEYVLSKVIKHMSELGKEVVGFILKKDKWMFKGIEDFKDHYTALRAALERDAANSPLGILVAEDCQNLGIPKVLATSTHHHDALTQPIQDYCGRRRWTLVDCNPGSPNEKAEASFWQRAYETLRGEMK